MKKFFDINKFPKGYGILVFPISISRTDNGTGQDPKQCLEYVEHFSPSKVTDPKIGLNLVYADFLYMHSKEPARVLKQKFMNLVLKHKNSFRSLIGKKIERFQIQQSFSYEVWNQLYLSFDGDFDHEFREFKKNYDSDVLFQRYLKEDALYVGREIDDDQISFFLEEFFMLYLISKKKIALPNEYVQGREGWVLWCYPGKIMKGQIYTYQKNILDLDVPENPYQNHFYDLDSKKLINCLDVDLESYNYSYE